MTLLINCSTTKKNAGLFDDLAEEETVVLYLSKYHLDNIPGEINRLKKAKRLFITADSLGWTIYPPLSALSQPMGRADSKRLPDEITELTDLRCLALVHLNLESLPKDFGKLKNLDSLNLSSNRLIISKEIEKLNELKNLRYLVLLGNVIDSADINILKKNNPGLTIQTWVE